MNNLSKGFSPSDNLEPIVLPNHRLPHSSYLSLMMRCCLCFLLLSFFYKSHAQPKTDSLLRQLLSNNSNALFQQVLSHPDTYRLQIIYTQINRDKKNKPGFTNYYFHYDPLLYFNPASMVKLPLAFLSLEKINTLHQKSIHKYTTIFFDSSEAWHHPLHEDSTSITGLASIAHFIKRAFLISENDPYNRMYQFVGQQAINRRLHQQGYADVRITRQFMGLTPEQNRITNPVVFTDAVGRPIYQQPEGINNDSFDFSRTIKIGKAYLNKNDSLVNEPYDFTKHNNVPLESFQQLLQAVLFPASVPARQRFNLTAGDRLFLLRYLSQYPSETPDPKYDTATFYDSYAKFFFRDSTHRMPAHVRVFNKVGWSYGFLTDVAYVVDFKNGVEFMLAATIYVNSDGVLNDNKYEYDAIGHPFLYQLGQTIYNYELSRRRTYRPGLSSFKLTYGHRDKNDKRPSLKEVDN